MVAASVAFIALSAAVVSAQTTVRLSGQVLDDLTGSAVPDARVAVGDRFATTVDQFGLFQFEHLPAGVWTVEVTATGYDSVQLNGVTITPDTERQLTVRLHRRPYELPGIEVRGERETIESDNRIVIARDEIEARNPRDLIDLLSNIDGVTVQTGGGAQASTVSIRGSAPEHVLILLDGQRIDMTANAGIDINSIPIDHVQQVEVMRGGASAEYGANALGGVISISTHLPAVAERITARVSQAAGRWDKDKLSVVAHVPYSATSAIRFGISDSRSLNDFSFNYAVAPRPAPIVGTRRNNYRDESSYFGSGLVNLSPRTELRLSMQLYRQEAGLPGPGSRQSETGYREDDRYLGTLSLKTRRGSHALSIDLGANRYRQYFEDTAVTPAERYLTEFTNDRFNLRVIDKLSIDRHTDLMIGGEAARDVVIHDDLLRSQLSMGRSVRDNGAVFMQLQRDLVLPDAVFFDLVSFDAALRRDWSTTRKDSTSFVDITPSHAHSELSPRIGGAVSVGDDWSLIVRGSWGESYRLPTLNALFWHGDVRSRGNPGLRPERSDHLEYGMSGSVKLSWLRLDGEVTWHRADITDLIVWRTGQGGVWQPANLASARLSGHDESITASVLDDRLRLRYQNSVVDARNKVAGPNSYDKFLTFRPGYQTRLSSELRFAWLRAEYAVRWVDKRYATEANTKYYDAYTVHDARLGITVQPHDHWRIDLDSRLDNVWQEDYVLIAQYPMPGRYWEIGVQVSYEQ